MANLLANMSLDNFRIDEIYLPRYQKGRQGEGGNGTSSALVVEIELMLMGDRFG